MDPTAKFWTLTSPETLFEQPNHVAYPKMQRAAIFCLPSLHAYILRAVSRQVGWGKIAGVDKAPSSRGWATWVQILWNPYAADIISCEDTQFGTIICL